MVASPTPLSTPEPLREPAFRGYGAEAGVAFLVLVVAAAVLVPTWLLGGFRQVDLPEVQAGQRVAYEEAAITVRSAALNEVEVEGGEVRRVLAAEVHAVGQLDGKVFRFGELFALDAPIYAKPTNPTATLAGEVVESNLFGDDTGQVTLEPGLPRDVWLLWQVPPRAQVPDEIGLTVHRRSEQRYFGSDGTLWLDPEPWLVVRVPVERV